MECKDIPDSERALVVHREGTRRSGGRDGEGDDSGEDLHVCLASYERLARESDGVCWSPSTTFRRLLYFSRNLGLAVDAGAALGHALQNICEQARGSEAWALGGVHMDWGQSTITCGNT